MTLRSLWVIGLLTAAVPAAALAQMTPDPYFTALNAPMERHAGMAMARWDLQSARTGSDFSTGMAMAQYGLTSRWTVGLMAEGQKILGQSLTFGGMRYSSSFHLFRDARWLNLTLYGEFEDLNGAALYKMEVAGYGGEDLVGPLSVARQERVRTFEQRAIIYQDRGRLNWTFNFIRESALQAPHENDYGYALGLFLRPVARRGVMASMPGMKGPRLQFLRRIGYGVEMSGALGNGDRFGFHWSEQQQYLGPVLSYAFSPHGSLHLEPAFGLSDVSDPFMMRIGVAWMFGATSATP